MVELDLFTLLVPYSENKARRDSKFICLALTAVPTIRKYINEK